LLVKNNPRSLPPSAGFCKYFANIERGIVRLPFVLERDRLVLAAIREMLSWSNDAFLNSGAWIRPGLAD